MPVPNKTHNLISQYQTFLLFVHISGKGGKKKKTRMSHGPSYAQRKTEGMRVEKLP